MLNGGGEANEVLARSGVQVHGGHGVALSGPRTHPMNAVPMYCTVPLLMKVAVYVTLGRPGKL